MPSKSLTCKIDQRSIDKYVKEQRLLGDRLTLSDETCGGLKLVINSKSCSWTYSYRKRGYLNGGKRHPQHTIKLGDPVSMSPAEARLAAETIKSQVRAGERPCPRHKSKRARAQSRGSPQADLCAVVWSCTEQSRCSQGRLSISGTSCAMFELSLNELDLMEAYPEEITPKAHA